MNTKIMKKLSLLMAVSLVSSNMTFAASNFQYQQNPQPQPQYSSNYYPNDNQYYGRGEQSLRGRVITVPAGITMPAIVSTPISSEYLYTGQMVSVTLGSDFYYNNQLIAPAGSTVSGTVTNVTKAKRGTINGKLALRFTEITTPYGSRIPISACIKTSDGTGILKGGTKMDTAKEYAKDVGIGAGAGALTGLVASAISGGEKGKGTAIMTGVGAGAGLVKSIWDKGQDVMIPANSTIELQIDQPITVSPRSSSSYDY